MRIISPAKFDRISGHSFLPGLMPADAVIVDLGANKGSFSSEVRRKYAWHCYAVEPNPAVWEAIEDDERLIKFNLAVTDVDGPVALRVNRNSECSSILPRVSA